MYIHTLGNTPKMRPRYFVLLLSVASPHEDSWMHLRVSNVLHIDISACRTKATWQVSGSGSRAEWLADTDKQVYAVIDEGF